jgi:hypothetical protein
MASVCSFPDQYRDTDTAVWLTCRPQAGFSPNLTVSNLATCLAWGNDSPAYGTFTLWNTQFHELYSPFKAHTKAKIKIQLLNRVYITIGMFFICGLLFLFIPFKNDIQGIWLIVTPGLFFVILWIYKFSMRKNIIIEDFKKMTN